MRNARSGAAEKHDNALADAELGCAEYNAAITTHLSARNAKPHGLSGATRRRLQPCLGLERHQGFDLATIVGHTSFNGDDAPARDRVRLFGELTEIGRHQHGRAHGACREQQAHQADPTNFSYWRRGPTPGAH